MQIHTDRGEKTGSLLGTVSRMTLIGKRLPGVQWEARADSSSTTFPSQRHLTPPVIFLRHSLPLAPGPNVSWFSSYLTDHHFSSSLAVSLHRLNVSFLELPGTQSWTPLSLSMFTPLVISPYSPMSEGISISIFLKCMSPTQNSFWNSRI